MAKLDKRYALKVLAENGQDQSIIAEMDRRIDEIESLAKQQEQIGSAVPQTFASMNSFIANPSTISIETFSRMKDTDPSLGAGIDFLILCMIARFGEYKHKNPEVEALVRRALNQVKGSFHACLAEMLSAEWAGFSLSEIVWKADNNFWSNHERLKGTTAWVPDRIVTYQPLTIVFAVDNAGEILPNGIFQYQRFYGQYNASGFGYALTDDGFRPDLFASRGDFITPIRTGQNVLFNAVSIPRDKVIHLTSSVTGQFGSPYGKSTLRRVYKNWVTKDAALKLWVIAMDRKAMPLVVGYAPPNDTVGGAGPDGTGGARADQALAYVLRNIHNESAIVLPGKKGESFEIDTVQTQADMTVFKDHIGYCDSAMMRGLLIPPMILGGDGGGSYALADSHREIFQQVVDGKLKPYKQKILEQLIKPMLGHNFTEAEYAEGGLGDFIVEEFDTDVMEKLANIYNTLTTAGYMSPELQTDMDTIMEKFKLGDRKAREAPPVSTSDDTGGLEF